MFKDFMNLPLFRTIAIEVKSSNDLVVDFHSASSTVSMIFNREDADKFITKLMAARADMQANFTRNLVDDADDEEEAG